MPPIRKALILGATGLIGKACLDLLLASDDYIEVEIWTRKKSGRSHKKLKESVIDFEQIGSTELANIDIVFCCLGTTIKKAGSKENFSLVDHDYVAELAMNAAESGVKCFIVISSVGANATTSNFYLRTKGKMEESVRKAGIPSTNILRPSMLTGDRDEFRFGESVGILMMKLIDPLLVGKSRKYRSIPAKAVASAMINLANENHQGIRIIESDEIARLAY